VKTAQYLVKTLADGQFYSGIELGKRLNITRAAVWKQLKSLRDIGVEIEAVTGKGYRIPSGLSLLDHDSIYHQLSPISQHLLGRLNILQTVSSTNDYLLDLARLNTRSPTICLAERQTRGKGRRGRSWIGSYGHNIYLSLLWRFEKDLSALGGLSLMAGVAILKALKRYGFTGAGLKWPNDVLYEGKKLAGILIESLAQANECSYAVIGLGLNTFLNPNQQVSITQPSTTLSAILHTSIDRNRLSSLLIDELIHSILLFEKTGLKSFLKEWQSHDVTRGLWVNIHTEQQTITGQTVGIGPQGELKVITPNGQTLLFTSGEVSLRIPDAKSADVSIDATVPEA